MALALQKLPPELQLQIQDRARQTGSFSPCPLLEDRACMIYDARAVICRTHGLPIATEYRDQRTVGFCVKNFKQSDAIPEKDIIDLAHLNGVLAELNMNFVRDGNYLNLVKKRYTIAEAMLQRWP